MKRRTFVTCVGSLAAGSAAVVGTGAFTTATANRSVSVNVADEDEAYLALDEVDGPGYENATFAHQNTSEQISIDINDAYGTVDDGNGVGLDSKYEFDNVFQIENQGTQDVELSIPELSDGDFDPTASGLTVQFYPRTTPSNPLHSTPAVLSTGSSLRIGLKVETNDLDIHDFSADATVSADAI